VTTVQITGGRSGRRKRDANGCRGRGWLAMAGPAARSRHDHRAEQQLRKWVRDTAPPRLGAGRRLPGCRGRDPKYISIRPILSRISARQSAVRYCSEGTDAVLFDACAKPQ
jgi:hypothetical protein